MKTETTACRHAAERVNGRIIPRSAGKMPACPALGRDRDRKAGVLFNSLKRIDDREIRE
jgi:hypothetical protein